MIITDRAALAQVLQEAPILYLALRAEPAPYVVPVHFGISTDGTLLYLHGKLGGRKIELLRADPRVGFSACTEVTVIPAASACAFTASASSVVGTGRARIVENEAERALGLDAIMAHYGDGDQNGNHPGDEGKGRPRYRPESLARTAVIAIHVESLTGRRTGPTGKAPADGPPTA